MDWNLIPTLEALLAEKSVSRAARRLGLSQPAVSNALGRLRRHFGDELLVRKGSVYTLTPFAEQLARSTRGAVEAFSTVASSSSDFDPATSERQYTIAASDYVQTVLGRELCAEVSRRAPHVALSFVNPFGERFSTNVEVVEATDGWFAPREMLPGRPHVGAAIDRWVCVVARDHPRIGAALTLADVKENSWVAPTIRGEALRLHLDGLAAHGIEPRVEVTTDSFVALPHLVGGSERIGVLQHSLARRLADAADVRILECPWIVQPLQLTFWWNGAREGDLGHAWLRSLIDEFMGRLELAG